MIDSAHLHSDAETLEMLLPRAIRLLYVADETSPLSELTVPQLRLLRMLTCASRTASSVGEKLGLSVSAVTQMVNRLEAAGLVQRIDDNDDRRVKHLSLTEEGRRQLEARRKRRVALAEIALAGLTGESRSQLLSSLQQLIATSKDNQADRLTYVAEVELRLPQREP